MSTATATQGSGSTQTRSNLGPLTTVFKAPSYCQNVVAACDTCDYGWQAQICTANSEAPGDYFSCWPSTTGDAPPATQPYNGWGFYSPGVACPSNYEPACSSTADQDGGFGFQFPLVASETAVGCCPTCVRHPAPSPSETNSRPRGYSCVIQAATIQTCQRMIGSSSSILTGTCPGNNQAIDYVYKTMPYTYTSSSQVTIMSVFTAYAPLVQLVHRSSDLASVATASSSATSVQSGKPTATSTTMASSTVASGNSSTGSLSPGATAGIGIGAAIAVVIIAVLSFFIWRLRRRRPQAVDSSLPHVGSGQYNPTTFAPTAHYPTTPFEPMVSELAPKVDRKPSELPGYGTYGSAELYGTEPGRI